MRKQERKRKIEGGGSFVFILFFFPSFFPKITFFFSLFFSIVMKAIVFYGKNDIRYDPQFPEPQVVRGKDVKIKIHYCGICGSDLHEYRDDYTFFVPPGERNIISDKPYPHAMGHEMSGEVVAIGHRVKHLKVGDKVVVEVTGTCWDRPRFPDAPNADKGKCASCQEGCYNACEFLGLTGLGFSDGGFSEYLVTDSHKLIKFDDNKIPMDVAALTQPLAVSWHAVRTSDFKPGELALILGGGPIGLTTIFALKGHKAGKIVVSEPALGRRLLAQRFNVEVFDPIGKTVEEAVRQLKALSPDGNGFNHSYDCSGVPATFETSIKALRVRGKATNVAVWAHRPVDYYPMSTTLTEKTITGSICFVKQDFEEVIKAIEEGHIPIDELKSLITSVIHLEDGVEKGFNELITNKDKHIKILFSPKEEHRSSLPAQE